MNEDDLHGPDGLSDRLHVIAGRAPVPPLDEVGLVAAGRARRRRRQLVVAAPLAACLLAVPLAWTAFAGGGDRLAQNARPGPAPETGAQTGVSQDVRFALRYDDPKAYRPEDAAAVQACLALPGTRDFHAEYSKPPQYFVTVRGEEQALAFQDCAAALPGITVDSNAGDAGAGAQAFFTVGYAAARDHTPQTEARLAACRALPGANSTVALDSLPPQYPVTVTGASRITAFADCIAAVPGATIKRQAAPPAPPVPPADQGALLAVHEQARVAFPEFYGGSELAPPGLRLRLAASTTPTQETAFRDWLSRDHRPVLPSIAIRLTGGTEAELGAAAGRLSQDQDVVDFSVDYSQGLIKVRKEYLDAARAALGPDLITEWIDAPPLDENGQVTITRQ